MSSVVKRARRLSIAQKKKRAAELTVQGWTLDEIAEDLGYASGSGVHNLLERHIEEIPKLAIEQRREFLWQGLNRVKRRAEKEATTSKDPVVRDRADRRIIRAIEAQARVSGVVKIPAPMLQVNLPAPSEQWNLALLDPVELAQLRAIQLKMSALAELPAAPVTIDAVGHDVTEQEEGRDGIERGE